MFQHRQGERGTRQYCYMLHRRICLLFPFFPLYLSVCATIFSSILSTKFTFFYNFRLHLAIYVIHLHYLVSHSSSDNNQPPFRLIHIPVFTHYHLLLFLSWYSYQVIFHGPDLSHNATWVSGLISQYWKHIRYGNQQ